MSSDWHFDEIPGASRILYLQLFYEFANVAFWLQTMYFEHLHGSLGIKKVELVGRVGNSCPDSLLKHFDLRFGPLGVQLISEFNLNFTESIQNPTSMVQTPSLLRERRRIWSNGPSWLHWHGCGRQFRSEQRIWEFQSFREWIRIVLSTRLKKSPLKTLAEPSVCFRLRNPSEFHSENQENDF